MSRHRLLWEGEERPRDATVSTLTGREWELALALEAQRTAGELAAVLAAGNDEELIARGAAPRRAEPPTEELAARLTGRLAAIAHALHPGAPSESLRGEVLSDSGAVTGVRLSTGRAPSLWSLLRPLLVEARAFDLVVAYASARGVDLLGGHLDVLRSAQRPVRILVGNYLGGTHPDGLARLLRHCGGSVQARFEADPNVHFHPKVYRVLDAAGREHLAVGSSNLSYPALTGERGIGGAVEWSLLLDEGVAADVVRSARQRIDALWQTHGVPLDESVVARFREQHPRQLPPAALVDEINGLVPDPDGPGGVTPGEPTPNPAQREALDKLAEVRARGDRRALVVAATGLGKTYLAAFDSLAAVPRDSGGRVLFVAHRREILEQACRTFEAVRRDGTCGLVHQDARELGARHVFASVFSLDAEALSRLRDVKYVVIDEAHHSAAASYRQLLASLHPESFLLGLTATPERLDGNSIYELFDGVVAYEKTLLHAIDAKWLVPFHYFGVPDPVDYSAIRRSRGRFGFDEAQLSAAVRSPERQQAALRWLDDPRMQGSRTLFFCIDIDHARETASALRARGQRVALVHSGPGSDDRDAALERLRHGDLQAIVSVDMLSEGVDIPAADRVVLLRPTESPTVFLQQIGRGLRTHGTKSHLTIIDLVGNHARARLHMQLLGVTEGELGRVREGEGLRQQHSDGRLIWILPEAVERIRAYDAVRGSIGTVGDRVRAAFERLGARDAEAAQRPRLRDVLAITGYAVSTLRGRFGSWFGVLQQFGHASPEDAALDGDPKVRALFDAIETTDMSGPHKMFVLLALARLRKTKVTAQELAPHVLDLANHQHPFVAQGMSRKALESPARMAQNLLENPFDKLSKSHPQTFRLDGNSLLVAAGAGPSLPRFWDAIEERAEARLLECKRGRRFSGELLGRLIPQGKGVTLMLDDDAPKIAPPGSEIGLIYSGRTYRARVAKVAINVVWEEGANEERNIATELFTEVAGAESSETAWRTYVRLWKRGEGVVEMELA